MKAKLTVANGLSRLEVPSYGVSIFEQPAFTNYWGKRPLTTVAGKDGSMCCVQWLKVTEMMMRDLLWMFPSSPTVKVLMAWVLGLLLVVVGWIEEEEEVRLLSTTAVSGRTTKTGLLDDVVAGSTTVFCSGLAAAARLPPEEEPNNSSTDIGDRPVYVVSIRRVYMASFPRCSLC